MTTSTSAREPPRNAKGFTPGARRRAQRARKSAKLSRLGTVSHPRSTFRRRPTDRSTETRTS